MKNNNITKPINLEVTLRDGGYQNNWNFSQEYATILLSQLLEAGIDWVEIGYRNGVTNIKNPGITGLCDNKYIKSLHKSSPKTKLSVMYSPMNINIDDIDQMVDCGVSMLRCTMPQQDNPNTLPLIKYALNKGIVSTANITYMTEYNKKDLLVKCKEVWENGCTVLYLADSNGNLTPSGVKELFAEIRHAVSKDIVLGFHNHNMLGMAMANAISAIEENVDYIDSSLNGMGRSSGNVPTECLTTWFYRELTSSVPANAMPCIIRAANYLEKKYQHALPKPTIEDTVCGIYNFKSHLKSEITSVSMEYGISWFTLIHAMAHSNLNKANITADTIRSVAKNIIIKNNL